MTDRPHLLRSFDAALDALFKEFKRMGDMTSENCAIATRAYLTADDALSLEAIRRDLDIDAAFEQLRADCFDMLLRFQPVARDLRLVMGIEHAVGNLERAGDHAKNIARRVVSNPDGVTADRDAQDIEALAGIVTRAIGLSVSAMIERSAADARQVIAADASIDARNAAIFDAAMVGLKTDPRHAQRHMQRLIVSKALERIGDHATNIAEEVLFITRGMPPGATRTRQTFG